MRTASSRTADIKLAARGRWPQILRAVAGLSDEQLRNRHQPCPHCGGHDRYRFTDRSGNGDYFCNQCGPGNGFRMVMLMNSCTFPEARDRVGEYLRMGTATAPEPRQRPQEPHKEVLRTFAYAESIWGSVRRYDDYVASHPYCQRKGIKHAAGAGRARVSGKLIGQDADCIVVPLRDLFTGELVGVECINAEGKKQTFGSKGVLILGNDLDKTLPILICEGWATTAVTVFGEKFFNGNACGIVAGGKSRLQAVADMARTKYAGRFVTTMGEIDE
jgi:phage/plasmid primase-like uncharacterized protein